MTTPTKTIRVYTKPDCSACVNVKRYLTKRDVPFVEEQLTPNKIEAAKEIGFRSAPLTQLGDDIVAGFDPTGLNRLIAAQAASS